MTGRRESDLSATELQIDESHRKSPQGGGQTVSRSTVMPGCRSWGPTVAASGNIAQTTTGPGRTRPVARNRLQSCQMRPVAEGAAPPGHPSRGVAVGIAKCAVSAPVIAAPGGLCPGMRTAWSRAGDCEGVVGLIVLSRDTTGTPDLELSSVGIGKILSNQSLGWTDSPGRTFA